MYTAAGEYAGLFRGAMKAFDNPLEDSVRSEMVPKYSFLLLMTFEGAIRTQEWSSLSNIVQVFSFTVQGNV